MKELFYFVFILVLAAVVSAAEELSEECKYVNSTYRLKNLTMIELCFNNYTVHDSYKNAILDSLKYIRDVYPYVEIAKRPPSSPSGYYKTMDYDAGLKDLEKKFNESGNVISKIFVPATEFVHGFRDGHFSFGVYLHHQYPNIFANIYAVLPFLWEITVEPGGKRRIYIKPNGDSATSFLSWSQITLMEAEYAAKMYVDTIDGKDAFKFLADFLGDQNEMKTAQGRLYLSRMMTQSGFYIIEYPVTHMFKNHTLVYGDGSKMEFGLSFYNNDNRKSRDTEEFGKRRSYVEFVDREREEELNEIIENPDRYIRSKREAHKEVICGMNKEGDMNYIVIKTFSPNNGTVYLNELLECVADFDKNDKPIAILLIRNGGGYVKLRELIQYLLMPTSDPRGIEAVRKSNYTRYIFVNESYHSVYLNPATIPFQCTVFNKTTVADYWEYEDRDEFGKDAVHVRTKKMYESFYSWLKSYRNKCLRTHVRKPTEIIALTDGFCFSACAFTVNNMIRSGSGIIAGFGATTPEDELFPAGQCPSSVIWPGNYNKTIYNYYDQTGIVIRTPITESYNISKKMNEIIPGDYDILRIDVHSGYNESSNYTLDALLYYSKRALDNYQTKCNPRNKRLLLVDENCTSTDPYVLYSGHPCGSDGKWDMKTCKISACQPGWITDFDRNKCVRNDCDTRDHKYNTSSYSDPDPSSSSSSSSSELNSASGLFPALAGISLIIALAIDSVF